MPYTRPGVYITENAFTTNVSPGGNATYASFHGTASRGPASPLFIDSWSSYKAAFGDLDSAYDLGYAVYHFFANGGRGAYVSRVVSAHASVNEATLSLAGTVSAGANASCVVINAKNVGIWGNSLSISVSAGLVSGSFPTFNVVVSLSGVVVESWQELSLSANDNRNVSTIINNYSTYIKVASAVSVATATAYTITAVTASLTTGHDGTSITSANWATSIRTLNNVAGQLIINLVGQTTATIVNDAISYCDADVAGSRPNSFLVVDPDATKLTAADIVALVSTYTASSYAAVYYGMLSMANPATSGVGSIRTTYPGGAVIGLYQRVETERSVGQAPAGYAYELRNAFGTVSSFSDTDVGTLYAAHVNTLKNVAGAGSIIFGARTLKKTDATKYIPSRRVLNHIKLQAELLTNPAMFKPITSRLFDEISSKIAAMLSGLWASGALNGAGPSQSFYVVCDSTNNTSTTIQAGELHLEIGVALTTPAEFIVINVSQFTSGVSTTETI